MNKKNEYLYYISLKYNLMLLFWVKQYFFGFKVYQKLHFSHILFETHSKL